MEQQRQPQPLLRASARGVANRMMIKNPQQQTTPMPMTKMTTLTTHNANEETKNNNDREQQLGANDNDK
jgi:hypothetical protein